MASSFLPSLFGTRKNTPVFNSLQNEIDRVFEDFRKSPYLENMLFPDDDHSMLVPKIDISETEGGLEVTTELPGVNMDEIEISVIGENLLIEGEKSDEQKTEEKNYRLVERSYGRFSRSVPLGFEADPDTVGAKFSNGILKVSIEKPTEVQMKTKKIKIEKVS
ncbi:Hsp20/alpha crystallin family protein [Lentilitoribacter sp. EG35]|uniref:Hsp20/alpha crystallin family protein n=1 Tax=Lentilitoribacter sp. EG35 TaxID=3234192 RepID=UPI003460F487